jgi:hypothetical protein
VLELQVIEHWDGVTPLVVGEGVTGTNMMLPLGGSGAHGPATGGEEVR